MGTGIVGQAEYFTGEGYSGATGGLGFGLPGGAGFTMTGEATYTWVWCVFNCRKDGVPGAGAGPGPGGIPASGTGRKR